MSLDILNGESVKNVYFTLVKENGYWKILMDKEFFNSVLNPKNIIGEILNKS